MQGSLSTGQVALGLREQPLLKGGFVTRKRPELVVQLLGAHILAITLLDCMLSVATYSNYHFCLCVCLFPVVAQRELAVLLCFMFQKSQWIVSLPSLPTHTIRLVP